MFFFCFTRAGDQRIYRLARSNKDWCLNFMLHITVILYPGVHFPELNAISLCLLGIHRVLLLAKFSSNVCF